MTLLIGASRTQRSAGCHTRVRVREIHRRCRLRRMRQVCYSTPRAIRGMKSWDARTSLPVHRQPRDHDEERYDRQQGAAQDQPVGRRLSAGGLAAR
jgi:hypothetical protein